MSDLLMTYLVLANADPIKGDPGRAAQVFYKIEDGKVVMYNEKGKRFVDADGRGYERNLNDTETPEAIALRMAKIIHKKLSGDGMAGFNRPIKYATGAYV